ncbi:hypothetical protein JX265_004844 [Neoarthrinium moseri]|uniref:Uncharacterized protein n=1 Tax=Neoarthrinium moseri TaxID=1658444 RepID=A0A9P9WQ49_9PEZI|nr:uncharacterized protein JN550_003653 [Neoarthrinium moseri]KAI1846874.1 hypothetical protein JX266_007095 [Neoarthrinium moseri]KAI1872779.1 hypothetical protein JN550_003653 [Neoarthrinium moseri]KAI1874636.1 hypothetical protein JX265_004844 [Neoarthrinium moseri]
MKYATALIAIAGLAAALPQPAENNVVARRPARRNGGRPQHLSSPNMRNTSYPQYSSNWAGSVQIGQGFNKVQGTITVPRVSGDSDSAASAWVGIDGDTCSTAILQTGISFYGDGTFDAWYEWIPDYSHSFSNFAIKVGDKIRMEVDASSKKAGVATLENLTTGKKVTHTFTSTPSTLCETNAEWIVEDFESGGSLVPFADFGTVTFTDASASGSQGTVTPNGGTIIDIKDSSSGEVLTDCKSSASGLTCTYTG